MKVQIKISFIGFQQIELDLSISENFEKNFVLEEQAEALDENRIVLYKKGKQLG